jgi:hypothetical protein
MKLIVVRRLRIYSWPKDSLWKREAVSEANVGREKPIGFSLQVLLFFKSMAG